MAAIDITFPDGSILADLVGNRNVYSTDPATSKGAGEIIYQSTAKVLKVNIQTVDPTTNPTWDVVGGGGATDHGALTGLSGDDHTQYLLTNGSRNMTGDLTVHKSNPNLILYPTDANSPRVALRNSANALKGSIYQTVDDLSVVSEDGDLYLATQVTTGGNIKLESKAVTQLEISNTEINASVPLDMNGNAITNATIAGTNGASFTINQDNVGAEVAMALNFNRGSTAADARMLWSVANQHFAFESVDSTTNADIKVADIDADTIVVGDHGAATTDEVVNVCYGTSATPPTASSTTEGCLYIQYTA